MRFVLDLQACQSPESSRRGIGRYSLSLAKAIAAEAGEHEVFILLNLAMQETIEGLRAEFDGLLPSGHVVVWEGLAPTRYLDPTNRFRLRASEVLRHRAIRRLGPHLVHVSSLVEGFGNDLVASTSHRAGYVQSVTLYDLIPLVHRRTYLADPIVESWYLERMEHLQRADLLLGISQHSCDEARDLLGLSEARLVDVSGAADDLFRRLPGVERFRAEVMKRFGIDKPFVMYAGGFDPRKNLAGLVRSFSRLPESVRRGHQLLIVGDAPPEELRVLQDEIREAGLAASEVVFAGYVEDQELVRLYNLCALCVIPSFHEGFGLPALEAMACGAVVVGSRTSSLPQVIGCEDALFDPRDDGQVARVMHIALTDEGFRSSMIIHAESQCTKFAWSACATAAVRAFEQAVDVFDAPARDSLRAAPSPASAWVLCPGSSVRSDEDRQTSTYAAPDCLGVHADHPLSGLEPHVWANGRVFVELSNDGYCARTLRRVMDYPSDLVVRDDALGHVLAELARADRLLVIELVYRWGGYHLLDESLRARLSAKWLDGIPSSALNLLGRCQVVHSGWGDVDRRTTEGWREDLRGDLLEAISSPGITTVSRRELSELAAALTFNEGRRGCRQWFVDVSNLAKRDAGTGIQRVVRHVLDEWMADPPEGYRVEPVVLDDDGALRYARTFCQKRYFADEQLPPDELVEAGNGDVYIGLDLIAHLMPGYSHVFSDLRDRGVEVYFVLYDLLPILRPDCFETPFVAVFRPWLERVAEVATGVICISRSVADEFYGWLHQCWPDRRRPLWVGAFHLGSDFAGSMPTQASPEAVASLALPEGVPTFLMVGTIEPRKGHGQVLAAFEALWERGVKAHLLIIGRCGWMTDDLQRHIDELESAGRPVRHIESAGDDVLLAAYQNASALLMASEGEGFGLPLIEAAQHGLPVVVRDLPVFREVVGDEGYYFNGFDAIDLEPVLVRWLDQYREGTLVHPRSSVNTWHDSAKQLAEVVRSQTWMHSWRSGGARRIAAYDYRLETEVGTLIRGRVVTTGVSGMLIYGPYVPLPSGSYDVQIVASGTGPIRADVCSDRGSRVHAEKRFVSRGDERSPDMRLSVRLLGDVTDLEVRIYVDGSSSYELTEIRIASVAVE